MGSGSHREFLSYVVFFRFHVVLNDAATLPTFLWPPGTWCHIIIAVRMSAQVSDICKAS